MTKLKPRLIAIAAAALVAAVAAPIGVAKHRADDRAAQLRHVKKNPARHHSLKAADRDGKAGIRAHTRSRELEPADDRGQQAQPGDDRGQAVEPGDDRGQQAEPGDDRGQDAAGGTDDSGHGGHGDDDASGHQ